MTGHDVVTLGLMVAIAMSFFAQQKQMSRFNTLAKEEAQVRPGLPARHGLSGKERRLDTQLEDMMFLNCFLILMEVQLLFM